MPEYLAPAVYVEETSFRAKSIEGVSTSTTAFAGPTRKGPVGETPELITSFGDFERSYGGFEDLRFLEEQDGVTVEVRTTNFLANAVKNYFDNGGSRLFVARVLQVGGIAGDGIARSAFIGDGPADEDNIRFVGRSPGAIADGLVQVVLVSSPATTQVALSRAPQGTLLDNNGTLFIKAGNQWLDSADATLAVAPDPAATFVSINLLFRDRDNNESFYENLGFAPTHPRFIGNVLNLVPSRRIEQLENTYAVVLGANVNGFRLHAIIDAAIPVPSAAEPNPVAEILIAGGNDGLEPTTAAYTDPLDQLSRVEDISIVAAPGYAAYTDAQGIQDALITHAERRRAYRFAVLDIPAGQTPVQAVAEKARVDSSYAGMYYPWIVVSNPLSRPDDESIPREIALPPSGFVCGIFARNDNTKGVAKSPANEVVRGALRYETDINFAEQELLNPRGVNCLRFFPGRGNRLWGARTTSSDPEWKYVGPRRYFIYLENSIDRSTQWSVFENNGPQLWSNIRETVTSFLYNEWVNGSLLGANPEEAYFVRCDRTTMTQNDLDNGRLICQIGVSVLKPAEFVVFRIGQKTADSRS